MRRMKSSLSAIERSRTATHVDALENVQRGVERGHGEDRRRAGAQAVDGRRRPIAEFESEGRRMAHPARQGRRDARLQIRPDIDEGWRAGSAIQIFVAAADSEIGSATGKIDRECASRMGEVPDHDGAARLCLFGEQAHVMPAPGAVVDFGQHENRDATRRARFRRLPGRRSSIHDPARAGGRRLRRHRDRSGNCRCRKG